MPPTDAQIDTLSGHVFGSSPTIGQKSMLRRLHFEASALVVQTYRDLANADTVEGLSQKRLPPPEKRARMDKQKQRLTGLELSGELEPSHQLIDLCNSQYESGILTWIPPSKCSKRGVEVVAGQKDHPSLLKVEQGVVKVSAGQVNIDCAVSDSLRVQWALTRRGLAYDQCLLLAMSCVRDGCKNSWIACPRCHLPRMLPSV